MDISSRSRFILNLLKRTNGYLSVKEIANRLHLTERTIYREISIINGFLEKINIKLETVPGKGMKLSGEQEELKLLSKKLNENNLDYEYDPQIRRDLLLFELLHQTDYLKAKALAIDLRVSIQTIRNDLRELEKDLQTDNLVLSIKKSAGYLIEGNELIKSHYLNNLLMRNIDIDIFFEWLESERYSDYPIFLMLEKYNYKAVLKKTSETVRKIIKEDKIKSDDTNFKEFIFLVSRMTLSDANEKDYREFNETIHVRHYYTETVEKLEKYMNEFYNKKINSDEKRYLSWLISVTINKNVSTNLMDNGRGILRQKVRILITEVEKRLGIRFSDDITLFKGLLRHLTKTLSRIRGGITLSNPMSHEIESNYNKLFHALKTSIGSIFPNDRFPDSEIGYMALYFIVSMDKNTEKAIHLLVVCSSGMGSSKMLASRLEREIPEVSIDKIIPLINLKEENLNDYDLVISTIPLSLPANQYIVVSPLLNAMEMEKVKSRIAKLKNKSITRKGKNSRTNYIESESSVTFELQNIKQIVDWGIKLIGDVQVVSINNQESREIDVIELIQNDLYKRRIIQTTIKVEEFNRVQKENDYFQIPNSRLAYCEYYLDSLEQPSLTVFKLEDNAIHMFGNKEMSDITSVIVMIYPVNKKELLIDFLSDLIMMIMENPNVSYAFEIGREDQLKVILEQRVREYLIRRL